jgi:hypothetical protein
VGAAIVRRHDLNVAHVETSVASLELDPDIRELHVSVNDRQVVRLSPPGDLDGIALRTPRAVVSATVGRLQERLILALKLVFQHNSANPPAIGDEAISSVGVRAMNA